MRIHPVFSLSGVAIALAATACAAPIGGQSTEGEAAGTEASALAAKSLAPEVGATGRTLAPAGPVVQGAPGPSTVAKYTCNTTECTCRGDDDCNKMFLSGKCDGALLEASCDETTVVTCTCTLKK